MKKSARERILNIALSLFYTQGVQNTGINQIIEEANVAKASFYHHFPSKEDLICECLYKYNEIIIGKLKDIRKSSKSLNELVVKWICLMNSDVIRSEMFNGCPIANVGFGINIESEKIKSEVKKIINEWLLFFEGTLEDYKASGNLEKNFDSKTFAKRVIVLYEGALTMWKLTGDSKYFNDLEEHIFSIAEFQQ